MKSGVLGGTFDPVHVDHLYVAEKARLELGLDRVLLLPAALPPHKSGPVSDYPTRLAMLREFVRDAADRGVCLEIDETESEFRPCPSYAYRTLERLKEKYASDSLTYIIGSDSLFKFGEWKYPERVAASMPVCVYPRGGADGGEDGVAKECADMNARYPGARFFAMGAVSRGVSSSLIRFFAETDRLELASDMLTPSVYAYIKKNGLYRGYAAMVEKLKNDLPEGLFRHSLNTAEWAVEHAWLGGVPFDRAFTAALLHDSAKPFSPMSAKDAYPEGTADAVKHQYDAVTVLKTEYGITDPEVLDAVKYHTTARPDMSRTGKLVFLADKLEKGRNYDGIDRLRRIASKSLDDGVAAVLEHTLGYLHSRKETPDELTLSSYEWYNNIRRQNGS